MKKLAKYHKAHKDRYLEELKDLLRIPSVSADPAYKKDVLATADFIKQKLEDAGVNNVEICPTKGYPIVYGEYIVDKKLPTVLVYGHYDVQPPDPLDLWESGPFEPVVKKTKLHPKGAIFARGACDDKGQVYMHIKAFEAMKANDAIPCNIKFMIEGEEEVGSENLEPFIKKNKNWLTSSILSETRPIEYMSALRKDS